MANIKQQIKRDITNNKKRLLNNSFTSSLKSAIKAVEEAVAANDKAKALEALKLANKKLDKSVVKGINHKNFVNHRKSRLSKAVNGLK